MSRYHFNAPCPHCRQPLQVDIVAIYNIEQYGRAKVAKAECCGRGVVVYPIVSFRAEACTQGQTADDWGRPLNTTRAPQT